MDNRPTTTEYPPPTLPTTTPYSGYPPQHIDPQGGEPSTSTQHPQSVPQDTRSNYSNSATPTSETSAIYNNRAPNNFPREGIVGSHGYVEGQRFQPTSTSSAVSEDSTVAAPSPAFAPQAHYGSQYPPGPHAMSEGYQQHPGTPQNPGWRAEWGPYGPNPHQMSYGHSPSPTTMAGAPNMVSTARPVSAQKPNRKRAGDQPGANHPLSQVYSFVPIPGATQNKRPRRRYEEIERMYKCGWNGCEKAYGTLNHLNAHVTMQGHGAKRTPDEFKEIRKEWKARKKEEEAQRKIQEDEARRRAQEEGTATTSAEVQPSIAGSPYGGMNSGMRQLPPPSSYQPNVSMPANGVHYSPSTAPTAPMENMQQYAQQPMYGNYAPAQYGAAPQQMFQGQQRAPTTQSNGNTTTNNGGEEPDADAEPDPDVSAAPPYSS
ncbi:hypothetical protein FPQ18DRAFT_253348 [Pyronema domesticum]|nr:hypothetical protein FPQ18DRAFT_253348 [Pyronema domesticum]